MLGQIGIEATTTTTATAARKENYRLEM